MDNLQRHNNHNNKDQWYCIKCGTNNPKSVEKCLECGAAKIGTKKNTKPIKIKGNNSSNWVCDRGASNSAASSYCQSCQEPRVIRPTNTNFNAHPASTVNSINPETAKKVIIAASIFFIVSITIMMNISDNSSSKASSPDTENTVTTTHTEYTVTTTHTEYTVTTTTNKKTSTEKKTQSSVSVGSLKFGDLISEYENGSTIIIKAKITPKWNNKTTIDQNYHNVEDLILNKGYDKYDEIQYWAVADMTNGSENKVISFTVSKSLIKKIKDGSVVAISMGDYVDDLYIHPSLKE